MWRRMPDMTGLDGGGPRRPLVGVTTNRGQARYGVWSTNSDLLSADYAQSVEAAGGLAVLLPPHRAGAAEVVAQVAGLIIAGGDDVDPERYGAVAHPRTQTPRPDRDAWELALLDAAAAAGRPVLGICRGMQLMAVHAGGSLEQHLPDVVGHTEHAPAPDAYGWISIRTAPDSVVRRLVGDGVQVNCHHHQAVVRHPGFTATAWAADGTIEAIEDPERPFWLAVQWHPEQGDDYGLFRALVDAARAGAEPSSRADPASRAGALSGPEAPGR